MTKHLSNRLEAWAERVRYRKLDRLVYQMGSPTTIAEYVHLREQIEREWVARYNLKSRKGVA